MLFLSAPAVWAAGTAWVLSLAAVLQGCPGAAPIPGLVFGCKATGTRRSCSLPTHSRLHGHRGAGRGGFSLEAAERRNPSLGGENI